MDAQQIIKVEADYVLHTYNRPPVVFTLGKGLRLVDSEGNEYLDFTSGIAVTALGHSDAEWVTAVAQQAAALSHVSNLYHSAPQAELAQKLAENSFADKVYFCNSGAEANEAAIKFARKYGKREIGDQRLEIGDQRLEIGDSPTTPNLQSPISQSPISQSPISQSPTSQSPTSNLPISKTKIVAFSGGFHGRTAGALSVTWKEKYRTPFEPLLPGVTFAEFNNLASAKAAIDDNTCAVIVEPVQGEGGVHPAAPEFLQGLRALCDAHDALLIFDEVQCGLGRTGHLWAYQAYGVEPDMMTLAKPLAGGLPIGGALLRQKVADVIQPGDHGSTFAAGPLVCAAANVVFDRVNQPEFLAQVRQNGEYLQRRLQTLESEKITAVRGAGLLAAADLTTEAAPIIAKARENGLLVISAGENTLRLAPALTINRNEIDTAVSILETCLD